MKDIADLLGRLLIGMIFLYEALDSVIFYDNMKVTMTQYGITWRQDFLAVGLITMLFTGSILIIIGYFAKVGALFLLLYWLPFSLIVYSFWDDPVAVQRINALNLIRNLAICGGLLLIMDHGSGRYSIRRMIQVMKLPKE